MDCNVGFGWSFFCCFVGGGDCGYWFVDDWFYGYVCDVQC